MGSYPAAWLALREPADHAARNRDVLGVVTAAFAGRDTVSVVDLASGAGSTLRACAPALPARQQWTLVDHDPLLLTAARRRLVEWADRADEEPGGGLVLEHGRARIAVRFEKADLRHDIARVLGEPTDLVTASALFDLVSVAWMESLVASLAARSLPLYAAITYTGREQWTPPHPSDQAINAAFLAHQRQEQAFGPAAGPDAAERLATTLETAGYVVSRGESPWILGADDAELIAEVADGIAGAAVETGLVPEEAGRTWAEFRRRAAGERHARTVIGHIDLCGFPRPRA